MNGAGFITQMISTINNNKRSRTSTFEKLKDFKKTKKSKLHFDKKASPQELKRIRDKIIRENELAFRRKIILISILLIIIIVYLIFPSLLK